MKLLYKIIDKSIKKFNYTIAIKKQKEVLTITEIPIFNQ